MNTQTTRIPVTIVMPRTTPVVKVQQTEVLGGTVVQHQPF